MLSGPAALSGAAAAQQPTPPPTPPPAPPTRADTGTLDTLRTDSPRRDARQSAADSSARDSTIARQLRESARTGSMSNLGPLADRLRLTAVGASGGVAAPRRVDAAALYSVHADYGELFPWFDVVFSVTYWRSSYTEGARRALARSLGAYVGDSVRTPTVRASVFTFGVDGRWRPAALTALRGPLTRVRPFVTGGMAVHFPNAEGAPITGTFVESSLDGVALGASAGTGLDLALFPNFQLTMLARYDLFNGTPYASLRGGASYLFERWRPGRRPAAAATRRAGDGA
jgi:hypothetical protein